jgi:hypothetical protein
MNTRSELAPTNVRRKSNLYIVGNYQLQCLCVSAETLHDRIKCTINLSLAYKAYFSFDVISECNYHGLIAFEDSKTWLIRFRLPNDDELPCMREISIDVVSLKHIASLLEWQLQFLMCKTALMTIPMNIVDAGYILLEKLGRETISLAQGKRGEERIFLSSVVEIHASLE